MFEPAQQMTTDRRGRVFIDGQIIGYESEEATFEALAKKYLRQPLRRVYLLSDPPQLRYDIDTARSKQ